MNGGTRVVITGLGALSALAKSADGLWTALLEGRSGIRRIPQFAAAALPATTGGVVEGIAPDLPARDRTLADGAVNQALLPSGLSRGDLGLVWATGLDTFQVGGAGFGRCSAGACFSALAADFGGPKRMIATACASGTQAIGEARQLIRLGKCPAAVAGGSSVILSPFYIIGFAGLQALALDGDKEAPEGVCRPFDSKRHGFALGDGAGALVVEALDASLARNAEPLAEVVGYGVSQDAFDLNRPPEDGRGAELCIRRALADAGLEAGDIDAVNAHATGTYAGDLAEAVALRRLFGKDWPRIPVSSIKGALGHTMAAAGALEAVVAVYTCRSGWVPPTVNLEQAGDGCELDHVIGRARNAAARVVLTVSFGMGGQNAALILKRYSP